MWYGAAEFEVAALEVFNRHQAVAEVCPSWRGSLVATSAQVVDLTDVSGCARVGAVPALGSDDVDTYADIQAWARFFDSCPGVDGVRYQACRARHHRQGGVATVLFGQDQVEDTRAQHRLIDDTLWPYLSAALDGANVALKRIDRNQCGSCR